jgi:hypothetical protein
VYALHHFSYFQALRFEILDPNSPYEIFVRELVAMDGVDSSEITLIDSRGCPTDHFIMGPLFKSAQTGKVTQRYITKIREDVSHFNVMQFFRSCCLIPIVRSGAVQSFSDTLYASL